jgi:hypothetical protein
MRNAQVETTLDIHKRMLTRIRTGAWRRARRTVVLQRVLRNATADQLWALGVRWQRRAGALEGDASMACRLISAAFINAWHLKRLGRDNVEFSYAAMVQGNLADLCLLGRVGRCESQCCFQHASGCAEDCELDGASRTLALQEVAAVLASGPSLTLWKQGGIQPVLVAA